MAAACKLSYFERRNKSTLDRAPALSIAHTHTGTANRPKIHSKSIKCFISCGSLIDFRFFLFAFFERLTKIAMKITMLRHDAHLTRYHMKCD